jgi:hypothetical protein
MRHGFHARHQAEQNCKATAFQGKKHPVAQAIQARQRRHEISNGQPKQKRNRHGRRDGSHAGAALVDKAGLL